MAIRIIRIIRMRTRAATGTRELPMVISKMSVQDMVEESDNNKLEPQHNNQNESECSYKNKIILKDKRVLRAISRKGPEVNTRDKEDDLMASRNHTTIGMSACMATAKRITLYSLDTVTVVSQ